MSFKLKRRNVTCVQQSFMSGKGISSSAYFVSMICKHCSEPIINVLRIKDMRKLGYNDGELRVVLSGGKLVGR